MVGLEPPLTDAESVTGYLRRLWLDKAVGLVYEGHLSNVRVHTAYGERYGRDEVVADIVQQLAAFPDHRFCGEGAVWSERHGLYSHLAVRAAHNTGYSVYGPPTGRRVRYRAATDLLIQSGRVAEVWSVHDGLALTRQLGLSDDEAVAAVVHHGSATPTLYGSGALELRGQEPPEHRPRPPSEDGLEAFVSWLWHELWDRRRFDRVAEFYRPDYRFFGPSGTRLRTREAFAAFALGLLAAFPDATVRLERTTCSGEHVAVRWRLLGTHDGPGRYGTPTGCRVNLLGITHHRLRGEQLVGECTVFDELALLAQLHAPSTDEAVPGLPNTPPALAPPIPE